MTTAGFSLDAIFQNIGRAVTQTLATHNTSAPSGDRYVTGGVNWNGYGLGSLIGMVANQSSPAQVNAVAGLWQQHGTAINQSATDLQSSLKTLMQYWQGSAASQSASAVATSTASLANLGTTATKMAAPIQDAAGALSSAQSTMPGSPGGSFFSGFSGAAGGAAIGMMMGGPFGAAAGAMIGGLASMFGFGSNQDKLKQQAVQTMQRYEQAGTGIDPSTPTFTAPSAGITGASGSTTITDPGNVQGVGLTPQLSTVPSLAVDPTGRWNALTGGVNGIPGVGGAGGAGLGGAGLGGGGLGSLVGGFGPMSGSMAGAGEFARAGSAGSLADAAQRGASSSAEEGAGAREGAGGTGSGPDNAGQPRNGQSPYGGGGGRGGARNEDDKEHRRRIPFEEDPFTTGMKAAPPVIGLTRTDRGDADQ